MSRPLKVFVSGPLTDNGQASVPEMTDNMNKAVQAGIECIRKGHYPFIPHLSLYTNAVAKVQGIDIPWERWMEIDNAFLCCCDVLLFIGSSKGSEIELSVARDKGIPIYYSVDEMPEVVPFVASSWKDSPY